MTRFPRSTAIAAACAALVLHATPAPAADASEWAKDLHSAVRLLAGSGQNGAGQLRAGVEIQMKPGWKTYWRYPGDSGVPPRFDFSGSTNLASATVLWPAPHGFSDDSGKSIGYKGGALFPIAVTPAQKNQPVTLKVKIDYAVCDKLCVPAEGQAVLTLDGKPGNNDMLLAAAEARVPQPSTAAEAGVTVTRVSGGSKPKVLIDVPAAADGKALEIFAEGPTPDWALPVPSAVPDAPAGRSRFSMGLDGLPPGTDPKGPLELTLTIVGGARPLEVKTRLD